MSHPLPTRLAAVRDLPRLLRIACDGAIAALIQDSLGAPPPASGAEGRARPGREHFGAPNRSASQGVPTPLNPLGAQCWRDAAEGEEVHPGSESPGVLAHAEEPPRGVPATTAAQIKQYRDALKEIAGRRCANPGLYGRCSNVHAREWWCPSCIAADAVTDREAVWP